MSDGVNTFLIHNLQTLEREISIEGNEQLVTMFKLFQADIPIYIAKLRELEELKYGKATTGANEEAIGYPLHLPIPRNRHKDGCKAMHMRIIPD